MIKESNIMQEKNVIQKLQTGVISVLNRKGITAFPNFHHSDDPGIVQKHSLIIVKKRPFTCINSFKISLQNHSAKTSRKKC